MDQSYQKILLVDHDTQMIDQVFELCETASLPPVKFTTTLGIEQCKNKLNEKTYDLLIAVLSERLQVDELALLAENHAPNPVIALLPSELSEHLLAALRAGACDLFLQSTLEAEAEAFVSSVIKQLKQAELIKENYHYREELENSLAELRDDQQAARQIQQNMLPDREFVAADVTAQYLLQPSLYLSGDFVDVAPVDQDRVVFYLADVSGHGASSALVTVLLKNMTTRLLRNFRRRSSFDLLSPSETLYRINAELLESELGKHLSIFIALYDKRDSSLMYAVGGHHPMPILQDANGCRFLEGRGMPVGLFPEPLFDERKLQLEGRFRLTLFSDGILEVLSGSLEEREQQLLEVISETKDESPEQIKDLLFTGIIEEIPDDIAIMTLSRQQ